MDPWNLLSMSMKLSILSGESYIDGFLLRECNELMDLLRGPSTKEAAMKIIENNF